MGQPHVGWGSWGGTRYPVGGGSPPRRDGGGGTTPRRAGGGGVAPSTPWVVGDPPRRVGGRGVAPGAPCVTPGAGWGVPGWHRVPRGSRGTRTSGRAGTRRSVGRGGRSVGRPVAAPPRRAVPPGWGAPGSPRTPRAPAPPRAPRAGTVLAGVALRVSPPPHGVTPPRVGPPARPPAYLGAGREPWGAAWRGRRSGAARCPGAHGRCRGGCSPPSPPPRRRGMARHGWAAGTGGLGLGTALPAAPVGLSPAPRRALSRGGRAPPPAAGPAA